MRCIRRTYHVKKMFCLICHLSNFGNNWYRYFSTSFVENTKMIFPSGWTWWFRAVGRFLSCRLSSVQISADSSAGLGALLSQTLQTGMHHRAAKVNQTSLSLKKRCWCTMRFSGIFSLVCGAMKQKQTRFIRGSLLLFSPSESLPSVWPPSGRCFVGAVRPNVWEYIWP